MKRISVLAASAVLLCSCNFGNLLGHIVTGDGLSVEETITVADFNAISSVGSIDVLYSQVPGEPSVVLTCDQNLAEYYNIYVEKGTLNVTVKPGYILRPRVDVLVTVTSADLNSVTLTGSGDCVASGTIGVDGDLSFKLSGSGDLMVSGDVSCRRFLSKLTGSGDTVVNSLIAESASLSSSGSGDIVVNSITADAIDVTTTGSGNVTLGCKDAGDVDIRITGSGDVTLSGSARSVNHKVSGSGKLEWKGLTVPGDR